MCAWRCENVCACGNLGACAYVTMGGRGCVFGGWGTCWLGLPRAAPSLGLRPPSVCAPSWPQLLGTLTLIPSARGVRSSLSPAPSSLLLGVCSSISRLSFWGLFPLLPHVPSPVGGSRGWATSEPFSLAPQRSSSRSPNCVWETQRGRCREVGRGCEPGAVGLFPGDSSTPSTDRLWVPREEEGGHCKLTLCCVVLSLGRTSGTCSKITLMSRHLPPPPVPHQGCTPPPQLEVARSTGSQAKSRVALSGMSLPLRPSRSFSEVGPSCALKGVEWPPWPSHQIPVALCPGPPSRDNQTCLRTLPNCLWGGESPL